MDNLAINCENTKINDLRSTLSHTLRPDLFANEEINNTTNSIFDSALTASSDHLRPTIRSESTDNEIYYAKLMIETKIFNLLLNYPYPLFITLEIF